jgi:hypothetical protein
MTYRERAGWSLTIGLFAFLMDWSGYDRLNPSLFVPKALTDVWWHFPAWVAGVFVAMLFIRDDDDDTRKLGL